MGHLQTYNQMPKMDFRDMQRQAEVFMQSGLFRSTGDVAKAVVKIQAGRELGLEAYASMNGINIIQGQVSMSAVLMGALVKRSGKYNYRSLEHTEKKCVLAFTEHGEQCGVSEYTIEDAQKANLLGKDNWRKHPKDMLHARALSAGVRRYCPDAFMTGAIYIDDEAEEIKDTNDDQHTPAPDPPKIIKELAPQTLLDELESSIANLGYPEASEAEMLKRLGVGSWDQARKDDVQKAVNHVRGWYQAKVRNAVKEQEEERNAGTDAGESESAEALF